MLGVCTRSQQRLNRAEDQVPPMKDAMSSWKPAVWLQGTGLKGGPCLCPWPLLRPTLVIRLPAGGSVVRRAMCWGLFQGQGRAADTAPSAGRSPGPWVSSAVSAGVSPVAAAGGGRRISSSGLISPRAQPGTGRHVEVSWLKCCSPLSLPGHAGGGSSLTGLVWGVSGTLPRRLV